MIKDRQQSPTSPENKFRYLFLRGEVIYDVEQFPDLFGCLALDHVGDSLAAHVAVERIRDVRGLLLTSTDRSGLISR
jgi:hypothetical protein